MIGANTFMQIKNPEYKKILQSIGGIRELLIHTPSVQFEMPDATGGSNYLKLLDANDDDVKYHLDRLGGRYGIGKVINNYEDEEVYELNYGTENQRRQSETNPLKPVKIDNEVWGAVCKKSSQQKQTCFWCDLVVFCHVTLYFFVINKSQFPSSLQFIYCSAVVIVI